MHPALRRALVTSLALGAIAACAPPRPAPGSISPSTVRATNADAEADLRTLDAWERRRAALVREEALLGLRGTRSSELDAAGSWLVFARDAYLAHRRSSAADEAFAEARRLIEQLERTRTVATATSAAPAAPPTPVRTTASVAPVTASSAAAARYPAQWTRVQALRAQSARGAVGRRLVDEIELELGRAAVKRERGRDTSITTELASRGAGLPAGVVPLAPARAVATMSDAAAACPLTPHLDRAERLFADAERELQQYAAAALADSLARQRLAFLADIRADERVRTRAVHFALDKDVLSPASRALLDKVAGALAAHPGLVVVLEGHTDPRGGAEYNLALSKRRAAAVRDYLASTGLDVTRIETVGFGLAARKTDGTTREAYALDRRVLVRFSMEDGTPLAETDELLDLQVEEARRAARVAARGATTKTTTKNSRKPANVTKPSASAKQPATTRPPTTQSPKRVSAVRPTPKRS